ncbi:hypothetical protein FB107DRAFT_270256 [Schizophyllum commune]
MPGPAGGDHVGGDRDDARTPPRFLPARQTPWLGHPSQAAPPPFSQVRQFSYFTPIVAMPSAAASAPRRHGRGGLRPRVLGSAPLITAVEPCMHRLGALQRGACCFGHAKACQTPAIKPCGAVQRLGSQQRTPIDPGALSRSPAPLA